MDMSKTPQNPENRAPDPHPEVSQRLQLLNQLGGLPQAGVRNDEWLYMLQEETRQSVAIEGYFTTDEQLEDVLGGQKSYPEIRNYFNTASHLYDLALQQHREQELSLNISLIRHIHSELFRSISDQRGLFRKGGIKITQAKVKPPSEDIEEYIRAFIKLANHDLERLWPIEALARQHILFESIHPFGDGNGRTGRILLNYLAIYLGFPPIIINGIEDEERNQYYLALEKADQGFHKSFPAPTEQALALALVKGNLKPLQALLAKGVIPQLDTLIIAATKDQHSLQTSDELAQFWNVKEATIRQWVNRGILIATKRDGRLYSHPTLHLLKHLTFTQ